MISAMQLMLDDLLSKQEVYQNAKMYESVATLETSIEVAKYLLEREKEQIQLAFEIGTYNCNEEELAQEYYNQTYNQNN